MLFFQPRLSILIFLPILGWKYSCIILKLYIAYDISVSDISVFVFDRFCYLKKERNGHNTLICGLVYVFCAEYCTDVLCVPFIELSLALNVLL